MSDEKNSTIELPVGGMSCASCAARVQQQLNKIDGVKASVNYATEVASIHFDETTVGPDQLVDAVHNAGYEAELPTADSHGAGAHDHGSGDDHLKLRVIVSAVLAIPVMAMAMVPALQFDWWQWVSGVLATPVVFWAGWPIHRAALRSLRHRSANMEVGS